MKKYFLIISLIIGFSGCELGLKKTSQKPEYMINPENHYFSTGSQYKKQLELNFRSHSDSHGIRYEFCESGKMMRKANALLNGKEILPQNPYELWLPSSVRSEIIGSWQFLNYILKSGGSSQKNLANLHFYYECWIDQVKQKENGIYSTACKNQFLKLMEQIINCCKTNFLIEFSPPALDGSGLSGLALDETAQNNIYSFLRKNNDPNLKAYNYLNNKFLIVGEKNHAIKVANFMNVQAGIEKDRLKIVVSDKMDEGVVGLFNDNPETRYCFVNSHKQSFEHKKHNVHNYSGHNEIQKEPIEVSEEKKEQSASDEISFEKKPEEDKNKLIEEKKENTEKKSNETKESSEKIVIKKGDKIVERIK